MRTTLPVTLNRYFGLKPNMKRIRAYSRRALVYAWRKKYGIPLIKYVQIQTHSRCNANCVFCPYSESWHAKNPGQMTNDMFATVLDNLRPFALGINQGKVCPYLMQEPLLDKKIVERIEMIYRCFPKTLVEISTNGAALTDGVVTKLLHSLQDRRHAIWVSHHGIDKESLKQIMRIDYDRATGNLINLLKRSDGRLKIWIRGLGASHSKEISYFTRNEYLGHWRKIIDEHNISTENVDIGYLTFHERAGTIHRPERNANKNNRGTVRRIDADHPFACTRLFNWIHIMYDGTIRLCCMDYHGEVELPSLVDMSLVDYFRSPEYRRLREMVEGTIESPPDFICKRCTSPSVSGIKAARQ